VIVAGVLVANVGTAAAGLTGTLNVLIHLNPPTVTGWKNLDAAFEAANPGVHINLQVVPTNNYNGVLAARLAAGDLDIAEGAHTGQEAEPNPSYVRGPEPTFLTQITAGDWVDLTKEPFVKNFYASEISALTYKGGIYGLPEDVVLTTGIFYNKQIFAKYKLALPRTWAQFLSVCKTLKSHGVAPLLTGGKDVWPAQFPANDIAQGVFGEAGMQTFAKDLWLNTASLTSPKAVEVLQRAQTVFSYTMTNFPGIAYAETPQLFASGATAMMADGAWSAPTIAQANPNLSFGYFPFPGGDTAASNQYLGEEMDVIFAIPSSSKQIPLAEKLLGFWASKSQYQRFLITSGNASSEVGAKADAFIQSLAPYISTGPQTEWWWGADFWPNARSSPLSADPFAYQDITPMGSYTDMASLAKAEESDWLKSLKATP
jgi:raffinose/stachyose/melibiose transport system substrate-binding protein